MESGKVARPQPGAAGLLVNRSPVEPGISGNLLTVQIEEERGGAPARSLVGSLASPAQYVARGSTQLTEVVLVTLAEIAQPDFAHRVVQAQTQRSDRDERQGREPVIGEDIERMVGKLAQGGQIGLLHHRQNIQPFGPGFRHHLPNQAGGHGLKHLRQPVRLGPHHVGGHGQAQRMAARLAIEGIAPSVPVDAAAGEVFLHLADGEGTEVPGVKAVKPQRIGGPFPPALTPRGQHHQQACGAEAGEEGRSEPFPGQRQVFGIVNQPKRPSVRKESVEGGAVERRLGGDRRHAGSIRQKRQIVGKGSRRVGIAAVDQPCGLASLPGVSGQLGQ